MRKRVGVSHSLCVRLMCALVWRAFYALSLLQLSYKLLNMIWHSRYIISTITVYIV